MASQQANKGSFWRNAKDVFIRTRRHPPSSLGGNRSISVTLKPPTVGSVEVRLVPLVPFGSVWFRLVAVGSAFFVLA